MAVAVVAAGKAGAVAAAAAAGKGAAAAGRAGAVVAEAAAAKALAAAVAGAFPVLRGEGGRSHIFGSFGRQGQYHAALSCLFSVSWKHQHLPRQQSPLLDCYPAPTTSAWERRAVDQAQPRASLQLHALESLGWEDGRRVGSQRLHEPCQRLPASSGVEHHAMHVGVEHQATRLDVCRLAGGPHGTALGRAARAARDGSCGMGQAGMERLTVPLSAPAVGTGRSTTTCTKTTQQTARQGGWGCSRETGAAHARQWLPNRYDTPSSMCVVKNTPAPAMWSALPLEQVRGQSPRNWVGGSGGSSGSSSALFAARQAAAAAA